MQKKISSIPFSDTPEQAEKLRAVIDPLSGYDTGTPSGWMATNALMAASDPRFAGAFWDAIDERGGLMRK